MDSGWPCSSHSNEAAYSTRQYWQRLAAGIPAYAFIIQYGARLLFSNMLTAAVYVCNVKQLEDNPDEKI